MHQGMFAGETFWAGIRFSAWQAMGSGHGVGCALARMASVASLASTSAMTHNAAATIPINHRNTVGRERLWLLVEFMLKT